MQEVMQIDNYDPIVNIVGQGSRAKLSEDEFDCNIDILNR